VTSTEILDVGCGPSPRGTVNIDLNPKFKPTVVAEATWLPFNSSVFDGVYLSHLLEHVINPERILREAHRVLKKGRRVTIVFPNFASFNVLMAWIFYFHIRGKGGSNSPSFISNGFKRAYNIVFGSHTVGEYDVHHIPLTLPIMRCLLESGGFRIASISGDVVYLPFRRFRFIRAISRALARILPSRADIITIVAKKIY